MTLKSLCGCIVALVAVMPAAAAQLDDLEWLSGHWVAANGDYEEVWLAPAGGTMVGSFRWVFPNGRQVLEFLVIEESEDDIVFRYKHFNTDYEPWEKEAPNTYRLLEVDTNRVSFVRTSDNSKVPYTMTYTRAGDRLTFVGAGAPGSTEEPLKLEFQRR